MKKTISACEVQRLSKERVFVILEEVWEQTRSVPEAELQADIDQALLMLRQELSHNQSNESPK